MLKLWQYILIGYTIVKLFQFPKYKRIQGQPLYNLQHGNGSIHLEVELNNGINENLIRVHIIYNMNTLLYCTGRFSKYGCSPQTWCYRRIECKMAILWWRIFVQKKISCASHCFPNFRSEKNVWHTVEE